MMSIWWKWTVGRILSRSSGEIPKSVDNLLHIALIRVAAHSLDMTEIKGKNERIIFTFRQDAGIHIEGIPALLKKYGQTLTFTAYGNPYFTYKYKKTGLVETDAQLLLDKTEELLEEMKSILGKDRYIWSEVDLKNGFHNATCYLSDYTWEDIRGYSEKEMDYFKQLIRDNAHLNN